ncbi:MAG: hypothetical protein IJP29_00850 [Lachnospiraceae bacterium]|nr:hypothetical protein [Lachnospiraceae bacterium]
MTKQEFLDELRQSLSGEVSPEAIMDAYRYYSTYIEDEMRSGKAEELVLEELGRPALIARSIIAANTGEREADVEYTEDGRSRKIYNNPFFSDSAKEERQERKKERQNGRQRTKSKTFVFDFNSWYAKVIYVLIFILLVLIVFGLIKIGFWVLIHFGVPILLVLGIVYLILYFVNR